MNCDYLVFDCTNMLYRTFFANKEHDVETGYGLACHTALTTLNMYFTKYKPRKKVVMAFDRTSWRKAYTLDKDLCLSGRPYKGNRRQHMTAKEKEKFERFLSHLNEFEVMMRDQTSVVTLFGDALEADDLIAGFVQKFHTDNEIVVVSSDKDFVQILYSDNVQLIDPATGKDRRQLLEKDYDGDIEYFMFEKCIRGDAGDNVQSAFPGVRKTRIRKAYTDPYERVNLMNETWSVGIVGHEDYKEFVVKELFEENQLLMDLRHQPDVIRERIEETINNAMENPGTYSHFHFLRFLGKYELKKITEKIDNYVKMLSR